MNNYSQAKAFCRFEISGSLFYGKVDNGRVYQLKKAPWLSDEKTGNSSNISEVKLVYPSEPTKILGLVKAYKQSWKEKEPPKSVRWFLKPSSSAASDGDDIVLPGYLSEVKVECELTIIIGKEIKDADENEAESAIFGYTVGNDIMGFDESFIKKTGDSEEYKDVSLTAGLKVGDRFAPYGPFIHKNINWGDLDFTLTITNDKTGKNVTHKDNTSNLIYSPPKIVSDLSRVLALNPGDVIMTGTSKSIVASDGDIVSVEIEGLGRSTNKIVVHPATFSKESILS
jgi:2-keto-4-pentenoate hydratase/2-oxohepta-3-ene-1,7-dioic acid hydratase in catechol pathway